MGTRVTLSKSCGPCRTKRRKCDLGIPGCSQCMRAGIICPGYKDAFSLRLRDETARTALKFRRRDQARKDETPESDIDQGLAIRARSKPSASRSGDSSALTRVEVSPCTPSLSPTVTIFAAEPARCFFMHTYAANGTFEYFAGAYRTFVRETKDSDLNFEVALSAPALALLATEFDQPALLSKAYAQYAATVSATQTALSDPRRCVLDSTLAAVLLLGLFESVVWGDRCDPRAWDMHALGAAALLELRGTKQLETEIGRKLFFHANMNIRQRCGIRTIRTPPGLDLLWADALSDSYLSGLYRVSGTYETWNAFDKLIAVRADIQAGNARFEDSIRQVVDMADDIHKALSILPSGKELQQDFLNPADCELVRHLAEYDYFTDNGRVYIFPSMRTAKGWNSAHLVNLYIAEVVRDLMVELQSGRVAHFNETSPYWNRLSALDPIEMARRGSEGILRTVPYLLHHLTIPTMMKSILILPLSSIAIGVLPPRGMNEAARRILEYMGKAFRLPGATNAWHMVQESDHLEPWYDIGYPLRRRPTLTLESRTIVTHSS